MSDEELAEAPWYAAGLRFRCTACGECCTGDPGHVWLTEEEIKRMAAARGMRPFAFKRKFVRRIGKRFSLRERENGDCVMLEGEKCTVYEAKPTRCTTFPFWGPVLDSPQEWAETAERCEGIDQGDLYSLLEIEQLLGGDATPLVEKHRKPAPDPEPEPEAGDPVDWDAAFTALEKIYADLDAELPRWEFTCSASGKCCDFDAYGHRLYVTALEAEYFFRVLDRRANDDPRQCPAWGSDRLCTERTGRMLGCRTYFCGPYPRGVPEQLHPRYHSRIQALHDRFGIPYQYRDILDWAADRSPADA